MKSILAAAFLFAFAVSLNAQAVDTTVCGVLKDPQSFNGKTVTIKGTVKAGFDEFVVVDTDCGLPVNAIWLSYPEGTGAKSGPAAMLQLEPAKNFAGTAEEVTRAGVKLERNKDFKQFDSLLSTPVNDATSCLGCVKYEVSVTLTGRLDAEKAEIKRDSSGKIVGISGFGNMNAYPVRLVLQSVSDVVPHEIDYSKPSSKTGKLVEIQDEFTGGAQPKEQPQRAHDAYGKKGDNSGVVVGAFKNEVGRKSGGKSDSSSPDGVLYNAGFNFDRLKGDLMTKAMEHIGEHVADLRNPDAGMAQATAFQLEYRAWITTAVYTIGAGQKSLTIPGSYQLWDSSWNGSDVGTNLQAGLSAFMANEAMLAK